jgi:tyrosyl-tRNA synthetase
MSRRMAPVAEQMAVLMNGTDFGDEATRRTMERELAEHLEEDRPLRVYCGFDPTSVDLTLGHTVPFRKLRQFQEFGHEVTFLIGNFTALVGDPTDRDKGRPMLSPEQTEVNARTYANQAFRILDPERTKVKRNSDWLGKLTFADIIRLASQFTVAQFLERDSFAKRYESHEPIHLHELLYPLMQGYDAVALETDVQVGGRDQLFNLMAGRPLQREAGQRPQVVVPVPLLVGLDGHMKMSKSQGNYIAIDDSPNDMFGKAMSLPDSAMRDYFTLVTPLHPTEVDALMRDVEGGSLLPMDAKKRLAFEITASLHGQAAADEARTYFESTFQRRETPDEMPEFALPSEDDEARLHRVVVAAGLAASAGEVRRLVSQGAVSVNGDAVDDFSRRLEPGDEIRVGRHRFLRVVAGDGARTGANA